ncbi:GATA-binding factor C-like [Tropilaelaps mercedesae]|uniref:GATA-binding factor C-like n=1 Tax=Tropilaelaps mercedesae TaxID=418985 RepID=A0A1V9XUR2_9ACAR|nr:GATA-binding factor C-like [Tropilaelaps mercedesae]
MNLTNIKAEVLEPDNAGSLSNVDVECVVCGAVDSSHWAVDEAGHAVCKICAQPGDIVIAGGATGVVSAKKGMICHNCNTTTTTLWRRNNEGFPVCNACGLYYKLHNTNRPLALKKKDIQTRRRKSGGGQLKMKGAGAPGSCSQSGGGSPKEQQSQPFTGSHMPVTSGAMVTTAGGSSLTDLRVPPVLSAGLSSPGLPSTLIGSSSSGVWPPAQAAAAMVVLGQNLTLQQLTALHGRKATATQQVASSSSTPNQVAAARQLFVQVAHAGQQLAARGLSTVPGNLPQNSSFSNLSSIISASKNHKLSRQKPRERLESPQNLREDGDATSRSRSPSPSGRPILYF